MAKISLRTFLTIYMTLSQRVIQVGKNRYLLELSELHKIGAHAYPSPRRATLLLASSKSDGPIGCKFREKAHLLSLKTRKSSHCPFFSSLSRFSLSFNFGEEDTIGSFVFFLIKNSNNATYVPFLGFLTLDTISAVHFHHLSTHATCVT